MVAARASTPILLGPFELHAIIGAGGMGEVWSAIHSRSGVPVAVKVLGARQILAEDPTHAAIYRRAFEREVQAVARLRHEHIITVLDHGTIGLDAARASGGALHADSPFLAMEMASGGTLADVASPVPWAEQRGLLRAVLQGLAHAHARGVIHRDLKPPNLLRCTAADGRPGWKLADFGIAHALSDRGAPAELEASAGTPLYMAPEQFRAAWRDLGPWTDLYGVGCVAWQLATGSAPFDGGFIEVMSAHTQAPLPAFEPCAAVPAAFERWLRRLLEKAPADRFQWAAHASAELDAMGTPVGRPARRAPPGPAPSPPTELLQPHIAGTSAPRPQIGHAPVPLPGSWRAPSPRREDKLLGAGLGLFGLRPVPLVDRDAERGALWRALREVLREGAHRVVVLRGDTGVGKTRIARWLHWLVRELGVAQTLWVDHAPHQAPLEAWRTALTAAFGSHGLEGLEIEDRVASVLRQRDADPSDAATIAALLDGADARFGAPGERLGAFLRALRALSEGAPTVLTLDDAQWGDDSRLLIRHLLDSPSVGPVLVVVTLGGGGEALDTTGAAQLELEPLGPDDHAAVVAALLDLEPSLSQAVVHGTQGNPLFAIQLVGDWIQRGLLAAGTHGYEAREGATLSVPDTVQALWSARLGLDRDPEAMQIAAALGVEVAEVEWRLACRNHGVPASDALVSTHMAADLVHPHADGFRFSHGLFRESLLQRAEAAGTSAAHHAACADALVRIHPAPTPAMRARIARHLLSSGDAAAAEPHVIAAARHWCDTADYAQARRLLDAFLVARKEVTEGVTEARLLVGRLHRLANELDVAARWIEEATAQADERAWVRLSAEGRIEGAITTLYSSRDVEAASRLLNDARRLARDSGLDAILGRAWRGLAQLQLVSGDREQARPMLHRALAAYQAAGDLRGIAAAWSGLGWAHTTRADAARAIELFEEAARFGREHKFSYVIADASNGLGEAYRLLGRPQEAQVHYREATRLHQLTGTIDPAALINLGLVLVDLEEWTEAQRVLDDAKAHMQRTGQRLWRGGTLIGLALCAAARADWQACEQHLDALETHAPEGGDEFAELTDRITARADAAGQEAVAARARAVAALWK